MVVTRDQNAERSLSIKSGNSSFERVGHFKYLGKILTNQNSIQEEIKSRLNSENACYIILCTVFRLSVFRLPVFHLEI